MSTATQTQTQNVTAPKNETTDLEEFAFNLAADILEKARTTSGPLAECYIRIALKIEGAAYEVEALRLIGAPTQQALKALEVLTNEEQDIIYDSEPAACRGEVY